MPDPDDDRCGAVQNTLADGGKSADPLAEVAEDTEGHRESIGVLVVGGIICAILRCWRLSMSLRRLG